jgi:hypothetical protein
MADYKILTIPFARDAVPDMVNDIPETPTPSKPQLASYRQGFPSITTIPLVAGGIPPEGQDFNGILRDITEHVVHQNKGGMYKFSPEIVAAGGYPLGAVLSANDGLSLWVSLQNNNVQDFNSGTPTQWARIAFSGLDTLLNEKADKAVSIVAGTGLTGGGTLAASRTLAVSYGTTAGTAAQGNDSRLSDAREWSAETVSQAEAEAGTATTRRAWTAQRVAQAVRGTVLTGLSTASAAAVAASDSVLGALGKLQAQITALATSKLDATANAVSASKLQTARTINGVGFDGTANITVADATKLPLTGGTLTGTLTGTRGEFRGVGNDFHLGGIEVRGGGSGNTVFPTIGFNQLGLYAASLQLRGGTDFRFYAQGGSSYANVTAANFNGTTCSLAGRASVGDVLSQGWLRTIGATGWHNESYSGGIYMQDSTYVRVYNGKAFYCAGNEIVLEGNSPTMRFYDNNWGNRYIYCNDGLIGFLSASSGWTFRVDNDGNAVATGHVAAASFSGNGSQLTNLNVLGVNQTWQDVTASRSVGVTYTNTTGRPIQIFVTFDPSGSADHFSIDGVNILPTNDVGYYHVACIVPAGSTYRMGTLGSAVQMKWMELR